MSNYSYYNYYELLFETLIGGTGSGKIKKPKKIAKRLVKAFRYLKRLDKAISKRGEKRRNQSARLSGQQPD